MDPALWQELRAEEAAPGREVEAIIRLREVPASGSAVPGVRLVADFGHIATCRVPAGSVRAVRRHPAVASLKAARTLGPDLRPRGRRTDGRRPGVSPARHGTGLTGAGVVVGVVDWGLDVDHPSFRRDDGSTRVLALWDQRNRPGEHPAPYGYGRVHHQPDIDAALRSGRPYDVLGLHPGDADGGDGSHGCHVAAIAAGSVLGAGPCGVAPGSSLVFVHLADRGTSGLATLGDSVRLLEAVDFVRRVAGPRPWVVNISVGRHGGPHDGCTLIEMAFDELLSAAPGRFIVQSAGNYFRTRTHSTGLLEQGRTRSLTFRTHPEDPSPNELEIWYDGADEVMVRLTPPRSPPGPWVQLGHQAAVTAEGRTVGRLYHRARDPNNHDHHVDAFLSPSAPAGPWRVDLRAESVTDGRFDAWLERDDRCPHCQARFTRGSAEVLGTTGTIANGRVPLVVGAYDAHDPAAPVAPFSSSGPTRDFRRKPDLLAPGVDVLSARSAPPGSSASPGLFVCKSGTSMAAPHVAGAVALCLEATQGRLSARDIRRLVLRTTLPAATGPSERTGAGHLALPRLVAAVQRHPLAASTRDLPQEHAMPIPPAPASMLSAPPSRAFRELLYRPHGDLAHWLERHFEIVARPGQPIPGRPSRGDLLLDVPLGRPGAGTCTVLEHRYAAPLRLGPGQLVLHPRADHDGAAAPDTAEQSAPAHVVAARRVWKRLSASSKAMQAVQIDDIASAPSRIIAGSDFTAWTNSPTRIYVADLGGASDEVWMAVLYHESLHVKQFRASGGRPPADYVTMMRYECDAYTESARWVGARKGAVSADLARQMRATAAKLRREIVRTEKATSDRHKQNRRYRRFLLAEKLLPPHGTISELYRRTPVPRSSSAPQGNADQDTETAADPGAAVFGHLRTDWRAVPPAPQDLQATGHPEPPVPPAHPTEALEQAGARTQPRVTRSFPPRALAELPDVLRARPLVSLEVEVPTEKIVWMVQGALANPGAEPGWADRLLIDARDLPRAAPRAAVHVDVFETVPFDLTEQDKLRALHRYCQRAHPTKEPPHDALTVGNFEAHRVVEEIFELDPGSLADAAGLPARMTVDVAARHKLVIYALLPDEIGAVVAPRDQRFLRGFPFGKATLTPEHERMLDSLAREVVRSWFARGIVTGVAVQGHTDRVGGRQYNYGLGRRRAQAVASRLKELINEHAGSLPAGTVERIAYRVETFGEDRPFSARLHALNRRVELTIVRSNAPSPQPLELDVTVRRLDGLLPAATDLPAESVERLRCLLGKIRAPGMDDRYASDTQVFLVNRDNELPRPTEWNRVLTRILDPQLFAPGVPDDRVLRNLRNLDEEIASGIVKMNHIQAYASGAPWGLGLRALSSAFKRLNAWMLDRLRDEASVYSCYAKLFL